MGKGILLYLFYCLFDNAKKSLGDDNEMSNESVDKGHQSDPQQGKSKKIFCTKLIEINLLVQGLMSAPEEVPHEYQ